MHEGKFISAHLVGYFNYNMLLRLSIHMLFKDKQWTIVSASKSKAVSRKTQRGMHSDKEYCNCYTMLRTSVDLTGSKDKHADSPREVKLPNLPF